MGNTLNSLLDDQDIENGTGREIAAGGIDHPVGAAPGYIPAGRNGGGRGNDHQVVAGIGWTGIGNGISGSGYTGGYRERRFAAGDPEITVQLKGIVVYRLQR